MPSSRSRSVLSGPAASVTSFRSAQSVTPSMSNSQAPSRRSVVFAKKGRGGPRRAASVGSRSTRAPSTRSARSGRSSARPQTAPRATARKALSSGVLSISPALAHAYWDAALHSTPPNIPTTYGNFTCVNSIARFAISTGASLPTQLQVTWTPSALRITRFSGALSGATKLASYQQSQLNSSNTAPLDIRPLRMCFKIRNTTSALNVASNIVAVLVPQSISLQYSATGGADMPFISAAGVASLWSLCENNPMAASFTGAELSKGGKTFVMPPASFTAYNQYSDWKALSATSDAGAVITDTDWLALNDLTADPVLYPVILQNTWFGAIPPMYTLLVNCEPNALVQNFEIEVFCQDACRFPANSLVASMANGAPGRPMDMGVLQDLANRGRNGFAGSSRGGRA